MKKSIQNKFNESTVKAILFDLDGTLIDSLSLTIDAIVDTVNHFSQQKLTMENVYSHFGGPEEKIFKRIFKDKYETSILDYYFNYNKENISRIAIHDDIRELLQNLQNKFPIGVYTARCRFLTDYFMNFLNISNFFNIVIAGDEVLKYKPDKEGLIKFATINNIEKESVLFVGDTERDIECAKNANALSVFATWDSHVRQRGNYDDLVGKASIVLKKPLDLLDFI